MSKKIDDFTLYKYVKCYLSLKELQNHCRLYGYDFIDALNRFNIIKFMWHREGILIITEGEDLDYMWNKLKNSKQTL